MFTLTVTGTIARAIQGLATPPAPELDDLSEVDAQLVTDVSAMATVMPEGACAYLTSDAGVDALLDVIADRPDGSPQEVEARADRIYLYLLDAHDC